MFQQQKIGIIYRDKPPQFLLDASPDKLPWEFNFYQESSICSGNIPPNKEYLAIFFSPESENLDLPRHVSNIFPGAEPVRYLSSDKVQARNTVAGEDGPQIIQLPIPLQVAGHLFESFAAVRAHRKELTSLQRRSDDIQEFFEAFVNTVESSSSVTDRRLGMSLLIDKILAHIQSEECVLYLFSEGNSNLQRAYSTGNIKDIDLFEQHANSLIVEKVLSSGSPYVNSNYSFELKVPFSKESVFIRSILCYPLQRRGEKIGVIELINKVTGEFTREDQQLIELLVAPLTVAIRTLEMFENAERLTIIDDLTKLYNYRYLMQYLEADVKRCLRFKKKVSLLFIDVDGFKRINDTFGHLVGSQALAEMGQVFSRIVRETDVVGRYGGDEFVIVLPETPLNGAMVIAERIRKKVEECEFVAQNLSIRLTVSLGVANCPKHTLTAEGLIKKADAAMYRAKELSKNSIKVAV
jgi:diguanylate cyclase (GGDEF)-like protein